MNEETLIKIIAEDELHLLREDETAEEYEDLRQRFAKIIEK